MKQPAMEATVKKKHLLAAILAALALGALAAGCGSSSSSTSTSTSAAATQPTESAEAPAPAPAEAGGGEGGGKEAVPSEAESLATGDIPDNQVFLLFTNKPTGYAVRYPEGWARTGNGNDVTFREKGNVIHIVVHKGAMPSEVTATKGVEELHKSDPTVKPKAPERIELNGQPAVKIEYSRQSSPDPVTGKSVPLIVDRYEIGKGGKVAVIDLATPVGVDNVDAYRMISESFKWR
jgi:hypothetical protein